MLDSAFRHRRWGREQLDLSDGIWQGQISDQEREDLLELTQPLLAFVCLESIPTAVLESKIEPLELFSQQQLLQVSNRNPQKPRGC